MKSAISFVRLVVVGALAMASFATLGAVSPSGLFVSPAYAITITNVCEWNNADWYDMTTEQRRAWLRLGWTRPRWENDNPPASSQLDWEELDHTQQQAARELGFSWGSWNSDSCR